MVVRWTSITAFFGVWGWLGWQCMFLLPAAPSRHSETCSELGGLVYHPIRELCFFCARQDAFMISSPSAIVEATSSYMPSQAYREIVVPCWHWVVTKEFQKFYSRGKQALEGRIDIGVTKVISRTASLRRGSSDNCATGDRASCE